MKDVQMKVKFKLNLEKCVKRLRMLSNYPILNRNNSGLCAWGWVAMFSLNTMQK
jgi:hypothetical protein